MAQEGQIDSLSLLTPQQTGTPVNIWLDPYYYTKDAINSIFERITACQALEPDMEMGIRLQLDSLLKDMLSGNAEIRKKAVKQGSLKRAAYFYTKGLSNLSIVNILHAFIGKKLESFSYEDEQEEDISEEDVKEAILPFIAMQIIDHNFMSTIFTAGIDPVREGLLAEGSDENQGKIRIEDSISWFGRDFQKPILHYYKEKVGELDLYRVYSEESKDYGGICYLPTDSFFKGYQITQLKAAYFRGGEGKIQNTGFLLHKDGTLCQQSGIVFIHPDNQRDMDIFHYHSSPFMGQQTFVTLKQAWEFPSEEINQLTDLVGGAEKIKQNKLVFLPDIVSTETPTYHEAVWALPYLYELQRAERQNENLKKVIGCLEDIVVNEKYSEESETAMCAIEKDIDAQIERELENGSVETRQEIDVRATQKYKAYQRPDPGKKKWNESSKKARNEAIQEIAQERKNNRIGSLSEEEKTRLKKEKILENIRNQYLAKTQDRKHFDSSEVTRLLEDMRDTVERTGIAITGNTTQNGSHTGTTLSAANASVKVGFAKRPQKGGYQAGTLRTIIEDHIARIARTVLHK